MTHSPTQTTVISKEVLRICIRGEKANAKQSTGVLFPTHVLGGSQKSLS